MIRLVFRVRTAAYFRHAARALYEFQVAVFTVLALFVFGVNTTIDLRQIPMNLGAMIGQPSSIPASIQYLLTLGLVVLAFLWASAQRIWIVQPSQNVFLRSLPISDGTLFIAAAGTLLIADGLFWAVLADAGRHLGVAETSAASWSRDLRFAGLVLSILMVQLPALAGRFQFHWLLLPIVQLAILRTLGSGVTTQFVANALFMIVIVAAIYSNRQVLTSVSIVARMRIGDRRPRLALPMLAFGRVRMHILLKDNAPLTTARLAVCAVLQVASVEIIAAQPGNIAPVVALHLLCMLLLTRLVDPIVDARATYRNFLASLPRQGNYWSNGDALFVGAGILLVTSPHLVYAVATGRFSVGRIAGVVFLSLPPLWLFLMMRARGIKGMASYNIVAWMLLTWLIASLL
jgi:hypothetical protein